MSSAVYFPCSVLPTDRTIFPWRSRVAVPQVPSFRYGLSFFSVYDLAIPALYHKNHIWVREKLKRASLTWLWENPSCTISVGGPEHAGIKRVRQYLVVEYGKIFVKQNDGNCLTVVITNAVDVFARREVPSSLNELFFEGRPHFLKIREATLLLQDFQTSVEMREVLKCDVKTFWTERCCIGFFNPSAMLLELRKNPMSEITLSPKPSLVVLISSVILFLDVLDLFEMTSKRLFLSGRSCTGTLNPINASSSAARPAETSKRSLEAIHLPAIAPVSPCKT